jgi:hypothetical protein
MLFVAREESQRLSAASQQAVLREMASRRDLLEFDILSGSSFVNVVKWEPNQVDNHAKRCYTKAIRRPAW